MKNPGWVLVVEDDLDIATLTKEFLEQEGYTVKLAVNGEDALQLMALNTLPSLIITDYMMPIMNGGELIKIIKLDDRLRNVPIIIMSGNFKSDHKSLLGVPVLAKPLRIENLIQKIEEVLENPTHW
jgi:CheY-like chemotaxis protein